MFSSLTAQTNELIIRWQPGEVRTDVVGATDRSWLAEDLHIELLQYPSTASCDRARKILAGSRSVIALERNRKIDFRNTPNDANYGEEQQNLSRAGFPEAWELTTGGKTEAGEEIVVAVLDAGFNYRHADLRPNLWENDGEFPGDVRDNDGNGYVNDVHGWDMIGDDPILPDNPHGTQVAGILGARGNNTIGVTGTNWNIKLMLFAINTTANIIEAYQYVLYQRKRWNDTNGEEGAFVVATNASFGIEGNTCSNFGVWGGLYDELGREGILTAASTANRSWDVDVNGDMPTDCPSDFLIGVANVGENDVLYRSSGFGRQHVDLAAPGEGSYTTRSGGTYGVFGSTSAAAPYVTGAIALLYATPCESFSERVKRDPAAAALLVRDAILSSTTSLPTLAFKTSSGGTLNVAEAQRRLVDFCYEGEERDLEITNIVPNPAVNSARIVTNALVFSDSGRVLLYDAVGRLTRVQSAVRAEGTPVQLGIDVAGLPAGWYQVVIEERGRVARASLVVK